MSKTVNAIIAGFLLLSLFAVTLGFYLFNRYSANLPDYEQLKSYSPIITTRIYAADGSLLNEFSKEKRIFVPIEIIPKHLINAFLAAEDSNFYKHSGIDPLAIFRTSVRNIFAFVQGEPSTGGASTITQQVVKNFLLTSEKTWTRKIKEAILAFRMTQVFSKQKILELYLNQIYLGSGAYGVAAAAQVYFNKSIDELTVEEVALLATLPKAPSKLDPRRNVEKAKIRRDWVINRMLEEKFITNEEAATAIDQPIILKMKDDESIIKADFFSDSVKKELTELYGSDNVFESGIVVRTTLNPELQRFSEAAIQAGLEDYDIKHGYRGPVGRIEISDDKLDWLSGLNNFTIDKLYKTNWHKAIVLATSSEVANIGLDNGEIGTINLESLKWAKKYISADAVGAVVKKVSDVLKKGDIIMVEKAKGKELYNLRQIPEVNGGLIAIDPHTGRILAMMGGYIDAPNQFNRAVQAQRQPGSVLKTFGYIAALENGLTPATIIMDEEITLDQGGALPPYKPTNYSNHFYGPTTLRMGLEQSINVTTVRMASQIGLDKVTEVISRFGINSNPEQIYSIVLGSTETTLVKLVSAYSTIVNGGKKITTAMIEKIQDRDGKILYRRDKRECDDCIIRDDGKNPFFPILYDNREQILDPETAYQITSMLEGGVQRGTSARAKSIGKIIGGKTGTTNNSYDSWFVGFSPDLVVGVYVGFDIPKTLGSGETGASVALPIFINFMKQALKDVPSTPFRVPNGIKFVKIDRTNGRYPTPATPKNDIIFEAFKLNDEVEGGSSIISGPSDDDSEEAGGNMGIY